MTAFLCLRTALESGEIRSARPTQPPHRLARQPLVKQGILLGFRLGVLRDYPPVNSPSSTRTPTRPPLRRH